MKRPVSHLIDLLKKRLQTQFRRPMKAQSYIELALILPILLIVLLGLIEVVYFIGRYLDVLDLTREAARFASVRDPFSGVVGDQDCSTPNLFEFYYDTACVFSPPANSPSCTDSAFCNGMNPYILLDPALDDVVISVYTVTDNSVSNAWPAPNGYWALSDHDADVMHNSNWRYDCDGTLINNEPYYTSAVIDNALSLSAPPNEGFIAVEFYYCHNQVLNLPIVSQIIPNPMRIHAYTIMPLPASAPSPTPKP
jgi:hypothetical protein